MVDSDSAAYRIKRSFGRFFDLEYINRLSTLREDSQEDNQETTADQHAVDTSEYEIIDCAEGTVGKTSSYSRHYDSHVQCLIVPIFICFA